MRKIKFLLICFAWSFSVFCDEDGVCINHGNQLIFTTKEGEIFSADIKNDIISHIITNKHVIAKNDEFITNNTKRIIDIYRKKKNKVNIILQILAPECDFIFSSADNSKGLYLNPPQALVIWLTRFINYLIPETKKIKYFLSKKGNVIKFIIPLSDCIEDFQIILQKFNNHSRTYELSHTPNENIAILIEFTKERRIFNRARLSDITIQKISESDPG